MPITTDSIIQAKMFQRLQGQEVLNVQFYRVSSETSVESSLAGFAQALYVRWMNGMKEVQSNLLTYERMELYEVNGLIYDSFAPATVPAGLQGGEILGTFEAVSVQQLRKTRATRHGWKRFAGVTEAMVAGGVLTTTILAQYATAVLSVCAPTGFVLTDPATPARTMGLVPIIWGGNDPDFPLGRYSDISSLAVKNLVSSQNTRKVGRGS